MEEEDQPEQETKITGEDRAFYPRSLQERKDRRLKWAQVIASGIDAAARLMDVASHFIR